MSPADPIALAARIGAILDELGIRYVVGGSVAASVYGEPRSTLDLDLMIEADESRIAQLIAKLRPEFYVDADAALEALRRRSTFNAIHFETSMKIDFFIPEDEPFPATQLDRRRTIAFPGGAQVAFYAPEDLIVRKLLWYQRGAEQSERQWRDVVGILTISWERIDFDYLRRAANERSIADLLTRAIGESSARRG
ncbi:MAG TPA: nucleotidyl transferase AbiEii/AbiGii toxin family protein [Thermoanaerobaculia bacterium]|nr:nucleotidyl transferase AbiEii/AbiGii toxin family protein [Thermoanaerobaculia bacterium]